MSQGPTGSNTLAPLTNVGLFMRLIEQVKNRNPRLPGLAVFCGPAGRGKSSAACYAYQTQNAYFIQCRSVMTKKTFLEALVKEMGLEKERTIGALYGQVCAELQATGRPLIIDEMDYLVEKSFVDIVRDIHEECGGHPIILIGEEKMPQKLKRWERFHGRILKAEFAQPLQENECHHLSRIYCPGVSPGDKLMAELFRLAGGSVRRICTNLSNIYDECRRRGVDSIDLDDLAGFDFFTGDHRRD